MTTYQENSMVRDVKRYFGFLIDKGYQIHDARSWYVTLKSSKCFIRILSDRSEISVSFAPVNVETKHEINLGTLIYYISRGKNFVGYFEGNLAWGKNKQLERLSSLLSQYLDQIESLFEKDFEELNKELALSQKKYGEILEESYSKKFRVEEKVWTGINLFILLSKIIGIGLLAFLGWGVSVIFVAETDIIAKLFYGIVALVIIIFLAVFTSRILKEIGAL
jgi:hypothetical protein